MPGMIIINLYIINNTKRPTEILFVFTVVILFVGTVERFPTLGWYQKSLPLIHISAHSLVRTPLTLCVGSFRVGQRILAAFLLIHEQLLQYVAIILRVDLITIYTYLLLYMNQYIYICSNIPREVFPSFARTNNSLFTIDDGQRPLPQLNVFLTASLFSYDCFYTN